MPAPATDRPPVPLARRVLAVVLVLAGLVIWIFPSDVVFLVAEQEHILLGRYSKERFFTFLPSSGLLLYLGIVTFFQRGYTRQDGFRLIAVVVSVVIGLVIVDVAGRMLRKPRYLEAAAVATDKWPRDNVQGITRSRPPNVHYDIIYEDRPEPARSYPDAPAGFPTVELTLTTDARGFRNAEALETCDIVAVGDSFTEGSRVSDEDRWPLLMAEELDRSVYNLGISGGSAGEYLNNFVAHGVDRDPDVLIVMLYEGNDLRMGDPGVAPAKPKRKRAAAPPSEEKVETERRRATLEEQRKRRAEARPPIRHIFKTSPIVIALERAFIALLGPVNADGRLQDPRGILSWMPVPITADGETVHYAFKPKRLARLYCAREPYEYGTGWKRNLRMLRLIQKVCAEQDVRLILTYAPTKPRVIMPLIRDDVDPAQVRDFVALETDDLPPAEEFFAEMYERLDVKEDVVRDFCADEGIEFVSVTDALRAAMRDGEPIYYTYDQHWTKYGHEVVADVMAAYLRDNPGTDEPE